LDQFDFSPSLTPRLQRRNPTDLRHHTAHFLVVGTFTSSGSVWLTPHQVRSHRQEARTVAAGRGWVRICPTKKKVSMNRRGSSSLPTAGAPEARDYRQPPTTRQRRRRFSTDATSPRELSDRTCKVSILPSAMMTIAILLAMELAGVVDGFAGRQQPTTTVLQRQNPPTPRQPFVKHGGLFQSSRSSLRMEPQSSSAPANDSVVRSKHVPHTRRRPCISLSRVLRPYFPLTAYSRL
jgi:hypothetical protein